MVIIMITMMMMIIITMTYAMMGNRYKASANNRINITNTKVTVMEMV